MGIRRQEKSPQKYYFYKEGNDTPKRTIVEFSASAAAQIYIRSLNQEYYKTLIEENELLRFNMKDLKDGKPYKIDADVINDRELHVIDFIEAGSNEKEG
jgi:hypothetical protein